MASRAATEAAAAGRARPRGPRTSGDRRRPDRLPRREPGATPSHAHAAARRPRRGRPRPSRAQAPTPTDRLERDAGERHRGGRVDDPDHQPQGHPARCRETAPTTVGAPRPTSTPPTRATSPAAIAGVDERDDEQVDDRRDERQPAERSQHDGQRRRLRRQRHAQALAQPARQASASRAGPGARSDGVAQATSPAVASVESWNPASLTSAGSARSNRKAAQPSAAAARPLRPDSRASSTTPAIAPGPQHGRRGAREHDVRDDGDGGDDRPTPTTEPPGHRPDGGRDDRDVPPGDRDHVTDAGGRERGRDLAIHPVAQPDQDPRGQSGLGLGQDARQRLAGVPPPAFEQCARDRPGGPAAPSTERRACPRLRAARGSARTGCRAAVAFARRP